jgi:hypothetical protein
MDIGICSPDSTRGRRRPLDLVQNYFDLDSK